MNPYDPPENANDSDPTVAKSIEEPGGKLAEAIKVFLTMTVFVFFFIATLSLIATLLAL
ncbi:MAG: hypothetical protein AAGG48_28890 [Planctomycetota bacterium]